jgi:hypothetical protein
MVGRRVVGETTGVEERGAHRQTSAECADEAVAGVVRRDDGDGSLRYGVGISAFGLNDKPGWSGCRMGLAPTGKRRFSGRTA